MTPRTVAAGDFLTLHYRLSGPDGEAFRWQTESNIVADRTITTDALGMPEPNMLRAEVAMYAAVGLFGGKPPDISRMFDTSVLKTIYDISGTVIWPSK